MTLTIALPTWLLWTIGLVVGIPVLVALVILAGIGLGFARSMDRWFGW